MTMGELPLLSEAEKEQLKAWAGRPSMAPEATVGARFEEQVRLTPDRVAVVAGGQTLTYADLNRRANRLARLLRTLGVGPDRLVGICVERSAELIVGLLAILKAGGAYVPLDPSYPRDRLAFMLADTAAPVLLTQSHLQDALPAHGARVICLDTDLEAPLPGGGASEDEEDLPDAGVRPQHLAYVSYTSGSTGRPKGVLIPHRAVVRLVRGSDFADLRPEDIFLQLAPVPFDASTLEIWGALLNGARLVMMPPQQLSLEELARALVEHKVSVLWLTAGLFHLMVDHQLDALACVRQVLAGGDVLSVPHVRRMLGALKPGHRLINGYGPTENTTFTCCFGMTADTAIEGSVPIGRPIAGTQCYILDEHRQLVPQGVAGELYVGGEGLAHGYLNLPELTDERFVIDLSGERLYRTGDLVRWLPDGTMEFLGRTDNQVKLRGFRIELGEIEYHLGQHPAVGSCVVMARAEGGADKRLVAYAVAARGTERPSARDLRTYLADRLPAYMIPSAYVWLDAFPLNPNGKVDRKALPAPLAAESTSEYVAARTPTEEALVSIWAALLRAEQVGVLDDFFELGGHSLLATQVLSRVREHFGVELPLARFFEAPTVAGLAERIAGESGRRQDLPMALADRTGDLPLSFAQQRLWFFDRLTPDSPLYNVGEAIRLRGALQPALLEESLNRLVARHEALRTSFAATGAGEVQVVQPALRLRLTVSEVAEQDLPALIRAEARAPFDLTRDPLIRTRLLKLGERDHLLLITIHHIVVDGWSMGVLYAELGRIYGALQAGEEPDLAPLPLQYADFAAWQRQYLTGEVLSEQLDYWQRELAGAPTVLELPTDKPRPAMQSFRGARRSRPLPAGLMAQLQALSRREGATLFMTMLAAYQVLLHRYTGQEDLLAGVAIANRNRAETEGLIGFFVNTLAMRAEFAGEPTFRQFLHQVRRRALGAFAHQDLPLEKLVEALQPGRDPSRPPLVQTLFALQNAPMDDLQIEGVVTENLQPTGVDTGTAKYDLVVTVEESGGAVHAVVEYCTDLFDDATVERLLGHYETLLVGIADNPDQSVARLPLLSPAEERQLLSEWAGGRSAYPERTVHALFAEQARLRPSAVAVVYDDTALTYGELDARSSQLANRLRGLGVGPGALVGFCLERSPLLAVAMLGILKAGGAYLPLDPDYPADRLAYMLADSRAPVVLTQASLADRLPETDSPVIALDRDWAPQIAQESDVAPPDVAQLDDTAVVIYTSGSTGRPKGTVLLHRGIVRLLFATNYMQLSAADRIAQTSSPSFDAAIFEIWGALTHGATLVGIAKEVALVPPLLADLVRRERITVLFLTTALFNQVAREVPDAFNSVETVLFGGEACDVAAARAVRAAGGPGRLLNMYGPTESTTYATWYPISHVAEDAVSVPIGYPVSNTTCYVLDKHIQPVPVGVAGEIYIGGDGLAREYLNQPDLTAQRFMVSGEFGGRLYRTGDLGRWLPDGTLEFLGRMDHQVKMRGFRIELGEIETALSGHIALSGAVVLVREDGAAGRQLVAYLTPAETTSVPGAAELRSYLQDRLPDYMVPAAFVVLDTFPLTPNGKVDRRALPAPELADFVEREYAAPRTPVEAALAAVFAEVLGLNRVSIYDSFFELGGHSLLATRVAFRIQETLQVELPLRTLFERPTVAQLAEALAGRAEGGNTPPICPVGRGADLPLSFAQQRLWFLDQMAPGSALYNVPEGIYLTGPLDTGALAESLNRLAARHEILRTTFTARGKAPVQEIHAAATIPLTQVDLTHLPESERRNEAERLARTEARRPFDLARLPLLRASLYKLGAAEHLLLLNMHHIVADGWSLGVMHAELSALYNACKSGQEATLAPLPVQYADFAAWQQHLMGQELDRQQAYWLQELAGAPTVLALPTDKPRPAIQSYRGARSSRALPAHLMAKLDELGRREGATPFMTMLAAFQTLLHRYTGQDDLLVGAAIAGRNRPETEGLIGFFVGTLPMRADFREQPTFRQLLRQVRQRALGAFAHQDQPLEKLVEVLHPERNLSHAPLVQVLFALQNAHMGQMALDGVAAAEMETGGVHTGTAKYDLVLTVEQAATGAAALLEYSTDLFDDATVERLLGHYETLLTAIAADPDQPVAALPLLTSTEEQQVLREWCGQQTDYPAATVHALFAEQTRLRPEAVAVTYGDAALTYAELDRRSSQLANRLRGLGVGPDVLVGLCLERSPLLMVTLLGILKAGGAYLPLDPDYPADRLAYMVEDSRTPVLLTQASLADRLPTTDAVVIRLDEDTSLAEESDMAPADLSRPDDLAYVIYTSGSTGRPKGTAIPHRAIVRLLFSTNYIQLSAADRIAQVSNASFDAATFEIWGALLHGGTLVGIAKDVALTPSLLAEALRRERITAMFLTTSLFNQVAREVPAAFGPVGTVMVGGEALDVGAIRAVLAAGGPQRLLNAYGPTESTTFATWYHITSVAEDAVSVPIGYPLANTTCYVLDRNLQPVPAGVPGELCIGGDGLAREYLNRPDLTAQRFVHTPLGRLYRTGDLVRWLPDGAIDFLGRLDQQIKIRGFRVELGEIETALTGHAAIRGAVVMLREDGAAGKQLVAYLTPGETGRMPDVAELRSYLKETLPDYMIPAAFVVLDSFPLTPNGKLDRRALPAPDLFDFVEREFAAPRTPVETALAAVFAEVLGLSRISIHDSFFELGGHSLLATRAVFRIREALQVELPLRTLFERPTVAQLAEELAGRVEAVDTAPICPAERGADLPLSFAQQRLWFFDQMAPGSALYNVPEGVYLTGPLDVGALAESLNRLAARHEIFRTTFAARGQAPVQVIHAHMEIPLEQVDLTHLPEGERKAEAELLARAEARRPFDLTSLPLLRACLYKLGDDEHLLLLNMHHIVADGWSLGILHAELSALYNACKSGQAPALPPLPIQYADFAVWQRQHLTGEEQDRQQAYWLQELAGAPTVLALPTDKPRPATQSYRGAYCSRALPAGLMAKLDELGRREGATPFMTMLAAFQTLLHRYTAQEDLLVGSAIAGRNRPETEGLIGFFVGTLPMRADFREKPTFRQLLQQVRQRALGAFAHQDQPLEKLVEALQPERNLSHSPLVQVLFALQNAHVGQMALDGVAAAAMETGGVHMGTAKYDLVLTVEQAADGGTAMLEYSTDLFDASTVERLLGHYETLLTAIAADPDQPVAALSLLTPAEEQQVLDEWCGRRTDYPATTVHALFAEQVRLRPDAVAVTYGDESLTYGELDRRSSQLANRLRGLGVGPDVLVGLCLERSPLLVVALLGILKAGGAYLPLDPDYPADRIAFMVEDGRAPVLLTQVSLADRLPATEATVIQLDTESFAQESAVAPTDLSQPDDLAYVIYTSGSTGRPKGTAIPHRAIVRLLFATNYIQLSPADRIAQASNASFDAATFEIWGALLHGGTLVGVAKDVALTPALLAELLRRERITALFLTTALFNQVAREMPDAFNPVGTVMFGGEACDVKAVRAVLAAGGPQRLLHVYGPTESTTFATWYPVTSVADDAVTVPIGYPLSSTTCYVLDDRLQPVPAGVPGELCIGGDGLAREYLNQPDLTDERFVATPLGRLYRTGDLVRWLPDGAIEFMGRLDHQVKIRGFRIELGEIENALAAHPAVGGAVVVVRADGASGKRLVAYLKPGETGEAPVVADLRAYLKERLPEYMVPAAFVVLDSFPLNPNGKVDRRALPAPAPDQTEGDEAFTAPGTPLEEVLAGIFAEVLEVERVSVTASFFDLGGHSLLATRAASRIREALQVEFPLRTLFEHPTVAALALELGGQTGQAAQLPPILPVKREGPMPVSFAQQRLWFLTEWEPESTLYNVPVAYRLTGLLNQDALARSLNALVARHESLRTTFAEVEGRPVQIIAPPSAAAISLELVDASWEEAERRAAEEGRRPFDLRRGPLLRAGLLRLAEQEHVLLLTMHHIISDGWSMKVLTDELAAAYTAYAAGREPVFAPLPVQPADVAVWQQTHLVGAELERQAAYWRRHLAEAPALLELPTDRPRPPILSYRGGHKFFAVPPDLAAALERLSQQTGATLFMTLLAAWSVLLHRYARQDEVVIGTPIANRGRRELEGLVGFFNNTLALRVTLTGEPTFTELLRRVKETALGAYVHQDLPFEKLLEELQPERNMSYTPVFQVMFAFQENLMDDLAMPGLTGRLLEPNTGTAKSDLGLAFARTERGLTGSLEYFTDLFDQATIDRMIDQFLTLLAAITADPAMPVSRLDLLPTSERKQLQEEWNRTAEPYPRHLCLHGLFERQAAATPDATALVCGEESLTYAELNRRANQLARHLQGLGVGPDVPVGISLERSSAMVVALLAVLKAGGAYVPLDPSYPPERLAYMLSDSQAPVLLVRGGAAIPFSGRVVDLEQVGPQIAALDDADVDGGGRPEHLAYVIYTSGSTGRPKGVAVEHRNAVNFLTTFRRRPGMTAADTLLAVTSISFDIHVLELFLTLTTGARLVLATRDAALDGRMLAQMMTQHGVTVMQGTPATWRLLLEAGWRSAPGLKLLVGGEALAPDLGARLREGGGELWNLYGPTETTVWSTIWRVTDGPILIGRPIGNTQVYLLDSHLQPVPVGVAGELYIGGDGLARGYLNRPDLTAERFIASPWGRLYRTGDLARYRADGQLECLGRVDFQVKVRGFRIELGEIEATLEQHPAVAQAVVVVREDTPGDRFIAAYLVDSGVGVAPSVADLRSYLKVRLPDYMIPAAFVRLDRLPLTPGGKVDRKALPRPEAAAAEGRAYTAPRTFTEESLAAIWSQVLDVAQVGIDDNYFELGGDSIKSIRVRALAEERGLRLSLQDLFRCPTIRDLARVVQAQTGGTAHTASVPTEAFALLTPEDRAQLPAGLEDAYPASALQAAMLVQSLSLPEAYRNMTGYTLRMAFDPEALAAAARQMVRRHAILRTAFDFGTCSEPLQLVHPTVELSLDVADLRHLPPVDRAAELEQWVMTELRRVWDWSQAPLARLTVHRLTDDQFRLTVAFHHAIFDGWSVNAFLTELLDRYKAILSGTGQERPVAALPVGFRDYVALEREALTSGPSRAFWREQMADAPVGLPFGGPATRPGTKQAKRYLEVPVAQAVSDELVSLARQHALPVKCLLLAAHLRAFAVVTGRDDVVTGLVTNGRPEVTGGDEILGLFLNTVPLRVRQPGGTWLDLARQVLAAEATLLPHRRFPLSEMQVPPIESYFNYGNFQEGSARPEVVDVVNNAWSGLSLATHFYMDPIIGRLRIIMEYDGYRFTNGQADVLGRCYERVLTALTANPHASYVAADLLPDADRQLLARNLLVRPDMSRESARQLLDRLDELTDDEVDMLLSLMDETEEETE